MVPAKGGGIDQRVISESPGQFFLGCGSTKKKTVKATNIETPNHLVRDRGSIGGGDSRGVPFGGGGEVWVRTGSGKSQAVQYCFAEQEKDTSNRIRDSGVAERSALGGLESRERCGNVRSSK